MAQQDAAERADSDSLLLIGRVGRPHGVRGEVKVIPETDDPSRFQGLKVVYIGEGVKEAVPANVQSVRFQESRHGLTAVLKLELVSGPEEAANLRGEAVFARQSDLPPLEEDEFFLHDVVGLLVVTDEGETIGTVSDVMELPGQSTFVVSREGKPDVLIPAVPAFIADIDLDAGRMVITPIEGLLE